MVRKNKGRVVRKLLYWRALAVYAQHQHFSMCCMAAVSPAALFCALHRSTAGYCWPTVKRKHTTMYYVYVTSICQFFSTRLAEENTTGIMVVWSFVLYTKHRLLERRSSECRKWSDTTVADLLKVRRFPFTYYTGLIMPAAHRTVCECML